MDKNLFRIIVEGAPDPIFIQTKGRFAFLNPAACKLFGVIHSSELIGCPVMDYIHPDYHSIVRERIRTINEGQNRDSTFFELKIFQAKGGQEVWIETSGEPIVYSNLNGGLFFVRDITNRKQAEEELRASETKYRNLFRNHVAVKLIIDPETGNIFEANEAAEKFYGWKEDEMKKMNMSQINTLSAPELLKEIERARHSVNTKFNFRHRISDGTERDVEVYSNIITSGGKELLHSIVHDVTEKKTAIKQLKLLSRTVEQSPVSIVITNTSGNIEYVNPAFVKTTGYSLEEVKGRNPRILKSGYQSKKFYQQLWSTILSGRDWTGVFRNKKKSGQLFWEETVISPILNDRGEVINFVSIREDITERKKMVEDLIAAKEKAEENDRLKLAFLANMSHEMRTPMNGILGFAEILKEPGLDQHKQLKYLDIIQKSGHRMLDTVNDLIDISKIETGQVKMYITESNLNEQLENLIEFFLPQARQKGLELILKDLVPKEYAIQKTDRTKIDSILTNLIKNAIKFTDHGKIEVGFKLKADHLEYYVADTGIGIPFHRQEAIFNRFEQADIEDAKAFQGSGLGLTISRSYAKMLGGEIRLESDVRSGSTFFFTLPVDAALTGKNKPSGRKQISTPGIPVLKGKKVLIAEDDQYSGDIMLYLLERTGATLIMARNGLKTIDEFRKSDADLILLDIQLPEMSGFEVLKQLRAEKPQLIVIAQTAYAMVEDIRKFREAGFDDYLIKPIDSNKLYKLLNKYLA
ncbi:MAG: PAS domain S-box protein [Bacteroidales bacterium]